MDVSNTFKGFNIKSLKEDFLTFPLFIISHPFKGFDDMKYYKRGKMTYAITMIIAFVLFSLINVTGRGFVVTEFYQETPMVNVPYVILMTLAPIALFIVGNWSITSITDGKGKMYEILYVYTYALFPKVILSLIGMIISNFIVTQELAFSTFFYVFGDICFYFYLFVGLIIIHEYTFMKAVRMVIFTVLAMAIIIFVLALFSSLISEVVSFISVVIDEIAIKL